MRNRLCRICLCMFILFTCGAVLAANEKKEKEAAKKKEEKGKRVVTLKKGDPIPRDFDVRETTRGIVKTIKSFVEKMPKTHTAKIHFAKVMNQNTHNYNDTFRRAVMLNPKGKKDGEEWRWAGSPEQLTLKSKIPWKNGVRHGVEKIYGQGKKAGGYVQSYLRKKRPWKNGSIEGMVKVYYMDGDIMSKIPYEDGQQDGKSKSFTQDGDLMQVVPYEDGKREGTMIQYWPETGNKKKVVPCENGEVNGEVKMYYKDGTLKAKMHFKKDSLHGVEVRYNEKGEVEKKRYWLNGTPVAKGVYESRRKND